MNISIRVYFIYSSLIIICIGTSVQALNLLNHPNNGSIGRYRRQAECRLQQFKCSSSQCVDVDLVCDGQIDCDDGSDESDCLSLQCPKNLFQCTYGACIRKSFMCDGEKNCRDNSDEEPLLCKSQIAIKVLKIQKENEFRCNSGQYIDDSLLCDGRADCLDGSDETSKECALTSCTSEYYFQCDYGGCIIKTAKCNNVDDCADGSDERNCPGKVTTTTPSPQGSCLIPEHPPHGQFQIVSRTDLKPNDYAPKFSALITICDNGYKVKPTVTGIYPLCLEGQWSFKPALCNRACSPIINNSSIIVNCKYQGVPLENCEDPIDGTIATIQCETYYETVSFANTRICTKNGVWDYPITDCAPVCGINQGGDVNIGLTLGNRIKRNIYPWHVGVYRKEDNYICGGSIISLRVVLSAAHCFTDQTGKKYPSENYKIAGGKYYRSLNDVRDIFAQQNQIDEIHIPERYKGTLKMYEADIAVIVLKTPFRVSVAIQPVCLDRTSEFEYSQLTDNNIGTAVGWAREITQESTSVELKNIELPYKSFSECYNNVPPDFQGYLTFDKICAGYLNKNKSVCELSSGGGFTFKGNQNRNYIRGIISVAPVTFSSGEFICDSQSYGAYTLISKYIDFITNIEIALRNK